MLNKIKKIGIISILSSASTLIASSAFAFTPVNYGIGQFTNIQGLVGVATSAAPINNAAFAGGLGFANPAALFTSDFLLLGAAPGDTTIIADSLRSNNSVAQSIQTIVLTSGDIAGGIGLSFRFGYNGNSSGNQFLSDNDDFAIALINVGVNGAADGLGSFRNVNAPNYSTSNSISTILTPQIALQPGTYALKITVNENADSFNRSTAAGFNNLQIAPVPFEFNPAMGLGLLGAGWLGSRAIEKIKSVSK